jgi:hypothetical protein
MIAAVLTLKPGRLPATRENCTSAHDGSASLGHKALPLWTSAMGAVGVPFTLACPARRRARLDFPDCSGAHESPSARGGDVTRQRRHHRRRRGRAGARCRSGARAGDRQTGALGGAGPGRSRLGRARRCNARWRGDSLRHARKLVPSCARAAIDLSDGPVQDLGHAASERRGARVARH